MCFGEFFGTHLRMSGSRGVYDQTARVCHVGQQGEQFQPVDEFPCFGGATFYFKGEYRAATIGIIFLVQLMVGMRGETGVAYRLDFGVCVEETGYFDGVLAVALNTER